MTTEEKARAYDESLGKAKEYLNSPRTCFDIDQLYNIFPVLREDDNNEKIRKALIKYFSIGANSNATTYNIEDKKILAWLEKQGEQKPAEWSEEDERLLSKLQTYVDLECFDRECNGQDLINWLKSLRHQNTWKPSEEQMKYLHKYAEQNNYDGTILTGLYNDLKQFKQY